jgi:hypothetical protein
MIQLKPTNLFAIPIPINSTENTIESDDFMNTNIFRSFQINEFEILGTCTKDEISFNPSQFLEETEIDREDYDGIFVAHQYFWDYEEKEFSLTETESFYSLLKANEVYFENPLGEELIFTTDSAITELNKVENWQTAQLKVNEKYLIIQQK